MVSLYKEDYTMKKSKQIIMLGLSMFMMNTISYAQVSIPDQVFTDLSTVMDTIDFENNSNGNTSQNNDNSGTSNIISADLKDIVKYERDRNNSTLSLKLAQVSSSDIKESEGLISITLSAESMALNGLTSPVSYLVEKNDRLIRYFEFENSANGGSFNIYLMDNVTSKINSSASSLNINFNKTIPAVPKIVIDPGHGGKDPGAYAPSTQTQEKTLSLRTGLLLRDALLAKGYEVSMTRDSDTYPGLRDRSAQANDSDADVFISIHYNSAGATSASGIETFAFYTEDNKKLAASIQNQLISNTGVNNRGVKNGNKLIVLNTTKVPAVLVELGFLSNPAEAKRLMQNDYQNTLASAIAMGIDNYFGR